MFRARLPLVALTFAWLAALAAGQVWLLRYQYTTGRAGAAPASWPPDSSVRPVPGRFTLLLFAHPRCPCTRASLAELARVVARSGREADVFVVFVLPPGAPAGWERGGLWDTAAAIPGVRVWADRDGREARRFGAETSGLALLYDPEGRPAFRGGVTAGRGHEGDNPGREALLAMLTGREAGYGEADVFGCPLFDDEPPRAEGGPECSP